jgi:hypothetical protein
VRLRDWPTKEFKYLVLKEEVVPTRTRGVSLYLDTASCNFLLDGDIIQGIYNNYTRRYLEYLKLFLIFEIIPLRRILVT